MKRKIITSTLLAILLLVTSVYPALAEVINYGGFIEVDPSSHITKYDEKVSWVNVTRQEDAYVYYDFGSNYFSDNWTFFGSFTTVSMQTNHQINVWALSNTVNSWNDMETNNQPYYALTLNKAPTLPGIELNEENQAGARNSSVEWESSTLANTTWYYKIWRDVSTGSNGTLYCALYLDPQYATAIHNLSLTLSTGYDFRYLYALQSAGASDSYTSSGWVTNLSYFPYSPEEITVPDHIDDDGKFSATDNDTTSGFPSYCDENYIYWSWIDTEWINVGSCAPDEEETGVIIKDTITETLNDTREMWGLDNVPGGYITGLAILLIAAGICIYYKLPKWVIVGVEAVAFAACFALGLFEIWLIVIGAVLASLLIWWNIDRRKKSSE